MIIIVLIIVEVVVKGVKIVIISILVMILRVSIVVIAVWDMVLTFYKQKLGFGKSFSSSRNNDNVERDSLQI